MTSFSKLSFLVLLSSITFFQTISFAEESQIPAWIKNNAGWWADGQIDDSAFLQGIQFLIKEGIMVIPPTETSTSESQEIPPWIKNNAGWWAQDLIGDSDFVSGIQFLIQNGIIAVEQESSPSDDQIQKTLSELWVTYTESELDLEQFEKMEYTDITIYEIDDDQLIFYEDVLLPEKLQVYQTDVSKHQEIWELFSSIVPSSYAEEIIAFGIFTDGVGGEQAAAVTRDVVYPSKQMLYVDILDAYPTGQLDENFFKGTFIHELGHVISLGSSQTDNDLELVFLESGAEFDSIFLQKEADCSPNFFTDAAGCTNSDSYLNRFFQKFWTDIYDDYTWPHQTEDADQLSIIQEKFYTKYSHQFINDYAATMPDEDFAESFTAFVLKPKPQTDSIPDQKILFFYDYPEFVETRDIIRENLISLN